jgi:hypothetical protein
MNVFAIIRNVLGTICTSDVKLFLVLFLQEVINLILVLQALAETLERGVQWVGPFLSLLLDVLQTSQRLELSSWS